MKAALIDTSSAILLFKADLFQRLIRTYRIIMTGSVFRELIQDGYPGAAVFREYGLSHRLEMKCATPPEVGRDGARLEGIALDIGERETIRQYLAGSGSFIIIDDGKGAGFCRDHSIPYINALLFPRILLLIGTLTPEAYRAATRAIIGAGRYAPEVIDYARNCPAEALRFFLPGAAT
jgi:hypothetical protein